MSIDRQPKDVYITDSAGNVITDDVGNRFLAARDHRWELLIGGERVPLAQWTEGL